VLSYLTAQREIGVRMALGASSHSVGALVLKQSAWPVGIGLAIGCTLTIGVSAALLATPAAEQIARSCSFRSGRQRREPVASWPRAGRGADSALRAGRVNPLAALR
jgi:hypothetical protein